MSVTSTTNIAGPYTGNAVTTEFQFAFLLKAAAHLKVYRRLTLTSDLVLLALTTDYTLKANSLDNNSGGAIIMNSAPAIGTTILLVREVPLLQETSLTNQGPWYPEVHENAFDLFVMMIQQLDEKIERSLKIDLDSTQTADEYIAELEDIRIAASAAISAASAALSDAQAAAAAAQAYAEAASKVAGVPLPANSAEVTEGTDSSKYITPAALNEAGITATPVKSSSAEIIAGSDDAKFATPKALKDAGLIAPPVKASANEVTAGSDDAKFITAKSLADSNVIKSRWTPVTAFTATPASTSTLTMTSDLTAILKAGLPVKYTISSSVFYGIITAVAADLLTISGAPLGGDVTALAYGSAEMVIQADFYISGTFGNGTDTDLLYNDMKTKFVWRLGKAYCVGFSVLEKTVDTGAEPKINVLVNGQRVSTADSNLGVQLGSAGAWVANSAVAVNTAYYDINTGEAVTVECSAAGGTGDAADLTVSSIFILE